MLAQRVHCLLPVGATPLSQKTWGRRQGPDGRRMHSFGHAWVKQLPSGTSFTPCYSQHDNESRLAGDAQLTKRSRAFSWGTDPTSLTRSCSPSCSIMLCSRAALGPSPPAAAKCIRPSNTKICDEMLHPLVEHAAQQSCLGTNDACSFQVPEVQHLEAAFAQIAC